MFEKWEGWMVYQFLFVFRDIVLFDSIKVKLENKKNGSFLVICNFRIGQQDFILFVKDFIVVEELFWFLIYLIGDDFIFQEGIYFYDGLDVKFYFLFIGKGYYI